MNVQIFMDELGKIFERQPKPEQKAVFQQKLRRFSPEQLVEILNRVLEECRGFPKVSEVFKAAQELGFLTVDTTRTPKHHWRPSEECGLCHGEGRLCIFWKYHYEERDSGRVEVQQLVDVKQYTQSFDRHLGACEFRTVFRCKCSAGDAETLPKCWPKLTKSTPINREVWS